MNPTVVMTAMGKKLWSDPAKSGPMMKRTPQRKFAGNKNVISLDTTVSGHLVQSVGIMLHRETITVYIMDSVLFFIVCARACVRARACVHASVCLSVCLCVCVSVCLCVCVAVWLCGCVAVWLCGCVAVWLCGCVAVWLCSLCSLCVYVCL